MNTNTDWPSPEHLSIQQLDFSIQLNWIYNITTVRKRMLNIFCESKQQQINYVYSKTILNNGKSTINTSITGLLPNTTYTCCVLAVTSYGESEPACANTSTGKTTSEFVCSCCNLLY